MKERPILFSGPMVRAILDGTKTQTRRIVKGAAGAFWDHAGWRPVVEAGRVARWDDVNDLHKSAEHGVPHPMCPYGAPGDRLWVRETHAQFAVGNRTGTAPQCVAYRATCDEGGSFDYVNNGDEIMRLTVTKWTPAIHMPRWASRLLLEVTEVRAQRVQAITWPDIKHEGVACPEHDGPGLFCVSECAVARRSFAELWDGINGDRAPWASNPWVWAISFRRFDGAAPAARSNAR